LRQFSDSNGERALLNHAKRNASVSTHILNARRDRERERGGRGEGEREKGNTYDGIVIEFDQFDNWTIGCFLGCGNFMRAAH